MKKILTALALAIAALMLTTPIGIGAQSSDYNYTVNPHFVQLGLTLLSPMVFHSAGVQASAALYATLLDSSRKRTTSRR